MGDNKQTKTENRDPYAPAVPYINDIMGQASTLFKSGAGTGMWDGPTLSTLDPRTMDAMSMTEANARGSNTSLPFQFGNSMIAGGGITPGMSMPMNQIGAVASGRNAINTGGIYGGLLDRAGTQNAGANGILGGIAGGNPITTAGKYGDVAAGAPGTNADVAGMLTGTAAGYRSLAGSAGGPTAADSYITDMAKGGQDNPALERILQANADRIANRVNSATSAAGRYGSAGHTQVLARSIAEANDPLIAAAYEGDQGRRLQATGLLDASRQGANATKIAALGGEASAGGLLGNIRNANTATQLSALGGQTGAEGQNAATRLSAASGLGESNRADLSGALSATGGLTGVQGQNINNRVGASTGLLGALGQGADRAAQWAGMAPQNYSFQNAPAQDLSQIGQYMQGRSQAELDAERQAFEQQQNMPWQQLGRYTQGVQGAVPLMGNAGSSTSTTTQQTDPFRTLAGLGIAGGSLLMGNPAGAFGGFGMAAGGGAPGGQPMNINPYASFNPYANANPYGFRGIY